MTRILIVEDETKIARFVELELMHEGYEVDKALDGRTGVDMALANDYDLILLDVMLPELNGLEVLRRVRREKDTPVIMLTARDAVMDKVAGLDAGAADYITKPFAIEELLARVRVVLRSQPRQQSSRQAQPADDALSGEDVASLAAQDGPQAPSGHGVAGERLQESAPVAVASAAQAGGGSPVPVQASGPARPSGLAQAGVLDTRVLTAGSVLLDIGRHEVRVAGEPVELTNREFEVLRVLMENKGLVMSRDRIAQIACGYDYMGETNIIDVYVRHIRAKIDDRFSIKLITTVRGVGYVIREG